MNQRNILKLFAVFVAVTLLAGCEAGKGLGEDVENTGKNIKETIEKND